MREAQASPARAVGPIIESSVGTPRQPRTRSRCSLRQISTIDRGPSSPRPRRAAGTPGRRRTPRPAAGERRDRRAGTRPAPGSGSPRRRRCSLPRPKRRDGRGCTARPAPYRRCPGSSCPLRRRRIRRRRRRARSAGRTDPLAGGAVSNGRGLDIEYFTLHSHPLGAGIGNCTTLHNCRVSDTTNTPCLSLIEVAPPGEQRRAPLAPVRFRPDALPQGPRCGSSGIRR